MEAESESKVARDRERKVARDRESKVARDSVCVCACV